MLSSAGGAWVLSGAESRGAESGTAAGFSERSWRG